MRPIQNSLGRSPNGITFEWVTFDEGYGGQPEFLRELKKPGQHYVAEVPRSFTGLLERPRVATRRYRKRSKGRGRKTPRLASGQRSARDVESMLKHAKLRDQSWTRWNVKDGQNDPHILEVKHTRFFLVNESGLPGEPLHLIVARDALNPSTLKYFVAEAPEEASLQTMLRVAFTRWRVERCFEDQKSEIGLDQYEGRRYIGLKRHIILSCISYLFLSRIRMEFGGKNPELTECQMHIAMASLIPFWSLGIPVPAKRLSQVAARLARAGRRNGQAREKCTPSAP